MKSLFFDVNLPRIALTKLLSPVFPSVCISSISALRLDEIPEPRIPGAGWVKVKTLLCGVCASDMHLITLKVNPRVSLAAMKRHLPGKRAPKFLGHEAVGKVMEVGDGVEDLAPGDRVAIRSGPCCGSQGIEAPCAPCRDGQYALCENKSEADPVANAGGGFSEFFVAHRCQLYKVPPRLSEEEAALLEPAACSVHAVLRRPPRAGERILVIGGGTIGLGAIQAARAAAPDCSLTALVKYPFQGKAALRFGADQVLYSGRGDEYHEMARLTKSRLYEGRFGNRVLMGGFDAVYDCVGSATTLHHGLRWVRARGTVVLVGSQLDIGRFDYTPIWNQEIRLVGSEAHGTEDWEGGRIGTFDLTARWIQEGKLKLEDLITHTFPLDEFRDAFRVLMDKGRHQAIKGAFRFEGGAPPP